VHSVVDIGCGVGTWLRAFSECGVGDFLGIDGPHVDQKLLQIDPARFRPVDLTGPLGLQRRFDMAVSLEVVENLPPQYADAMVTSLASLADVVVLSAAVPGQGGHSHVNEQWPDYWSTMFRRLGFSAIDCIRPRFWTDPDVEFWYAQNTILYANTAGLSAYPRLQSALDRYGTDTLPLVHPKAVTWLRIPNPGIRICATMLWRAIGSYACRRHVAR
ncbi:MAG: methyltransferase domain-containing protein, partial [Planctomycetota bacterium]|nr:methyltransferase domain-containing protein [Planctomycetota bacterium]